MAGTGEVRLVPKTAWMLNSAGLVVFLAVLIGTIVTGTKNTELQVASVLGVVYLFWFAVICARPPLVHVFADRCWRPRCLHTSRQRCVHTGRQVSMSMAVLSPGR